MNHSSPPSLQSIERAADAVQAVARRTPLLESTLLNDQLGGRVLFKPECLQVTGSFKIRGAFTKIHRLEEHERKNGVVAYSSGNHAQGVAAAARHFGIDATIVMPEDAPAIKIRNTKALGGNVVLYDRYSQSREEIGAEISDRTGATLVKPYDDIDIITGQGTAGLEIMQDCQAQGVTPDQLIAPCGGGGLIAGIGSVVKAIQPDTEIFVGEPEHYDDTIRSLQSGHRETCDISVKSVCDAIVTPQPGELTFSINHSLLGGGFAVTESEVGNAMSAAFEYLKVVVEPGGVVGLAAILAGKLPVSGRTTVVVLSGGNVDAELFQKLTESGQSK